MYSEKTFKRVCKCPLCGENEKTFMYMSSGGGVEMTV